MSEAAVEAALKELRKVEGNKRCFVCSERGPTYVDMDHNTFVCTTCAGILREFTFKLKGLSMATFTASEVKALKASGCNAGAEKLWLARFKSEKPQQGERESIRSFIKDTFVSKKYRERQKKNVSSSSEEEEVDFDEEPAKKKKSSNSKKKYDESSSESDDEKVSKKASSKKKSDSISWRAADDGKTKIKVSNPVKKTEAKPMEDLLDMDFGFSAPVTTNSNNTNGSSLDDPFDDFVSAGPPAAQQQLPASSSRYSTISSTIAPTVPAAPSVDPFDFGDFAEAVPSNPTTNQAVSPSTIPMMNTGAQQQQLHQPTQQQQHPSTMMPQVMTSAPQQQQQQQQQQFPAMNPMMQSAQPMNTMMPPYQATPFPPMGFGQMPSNPQDMMQMMQNNPQMMQMMMQMMMQQQQQQQQQNYPGQMMAPTTMQSQAAAPTTNGGVAPLQSGLNSFLPPMTQQNNNPPMSTNPKNPFVAAKMSNKSVTPPAEDIFGAFS